MSDRSLLLRLPWPGTNLSPNVRSHWAALATAKKKARSASERAILDQMQGVDLEWIRAEDRLVLWLEFVPPTRRSYDRDNLVARSKSLIDGMCDALQINDKKFTTLVSRVASQVGAYIQVKIEQETEQWRRS
jgi:crossover junction endodeoxyribonuclease RusA